MSWCKPFFFPEDNCPRCNAKWLPKLKHYQCSKCTAFMFERRDLLLVPDIIPDTVLGWYSYLGEVERNKSVLGFAQAYYANHRMYLAQSSTRKPIHLPWLPFDITRTQLERYLLLV